METAGWSLPENYRQILNIVSWVVVALGGLWLVTGVLGYFHRRAYNLTHAESGGSDNIKPDFLKVDHAARKAAIERGEAYDKQLAQKDGTAPPPPAETVGKWARIGATVTASFGLLAAVITTLSKAEQLQAGAEKLGSLEKLGAIFREYPVGSTVAVIVVVANVVAFTSGGKKKKK